LNLKRVFVHLIQKSAGFERYAYMCINQEPHTLFELGFGFIFHLNAAEPAQIHPSKEPQQLEGSIAKLQRSRVFKSASAAEHAAGSSA
jgi:hypothetical protein